MLSACSPIFLCAGWVRGSADFRFVPQVVLGRLQSYPMDVPTLSSSGVAKAVKPLRKHSSAEVAAKANALFKSWKLLASKAGVQ